MGSRHRPDDIASARPDASATSALLTWYGAQARALPWRAGPGERSDPYRVWLSEVMLQQTTVTAVAPYYRDFLSRWPDVRSLAAASLDEVLGAWAGLGYYSRARNLHRAARIVADERGGRFPESAAELRTLPGIGRYTAAAIAAIAFGEPVAAMDTNAERVIARLFAVQEPLPGSRPKIVAAAETLVPEQRPGDFAQALMDLGATICVPKRPLCSQCPLTTHCRSRRLNLAEELPRKAPKVPRPTKRGAAFVALDGQGAVYLVRRPERGLLGGMLQPPLGKWSEAFPKRTAALEEAPFLGDWIENEGFVRHVFTHFVLELVTYTARFKTRPSGEGRWLLPAQLEDAPLPTVMRHVIRHACRFSGGPF